MGCLVQLSSRNFGRSRLELKFFSDRMKEGRQETTNVGGTTTEPHLVFLLAATEWASLVPRRLWGEVLLPPTNA